MALVNESSSKAPYPSVIIDEAGLLSRIWQSFFRLIEDLLNYIGPERQFTLVNNQAVAAAIERLKFDKDYTSLGIIEYYIQRWTSSSELIQSGELHCVYRPDSDTWAIREYGTAGPDSSGVTFSITATGQVQYTSSNVAGTISLSRVTYRTRKIAAKSSLYSKVG